MKRLWAILAVVALTGCIAVGVKEGSKGVAGRDGVFVHISHGSDDPHRLLMGLQMASIMADDHDVLVYFDIKAIGAVLKDSEDVAFAQFAPSKRALAGLRGKGVTLMACPGCLKAAGKTAEDLAEEIRIADKKVFFSFTQGRILTLDY